MGYLDFEQAKYWSEKIHYVFFISVFAFSVFYKYGTIPKMILRFYSVIIIWLTVTYLNNGCPITYLENLISCHFYGREFYENYSFQDTDIKKIVSIKEMWYPLIILIILTILTNGTILNLRTDQESSGERL